MSIEPVKNSPNNLHPFPANTRAQPELTRAALAQHTDQRIDLRHLLLVLKRRRYLIMGTFGTLMLVTALLLSQLTPRYTATAQVMVDARQQNVVDLDQVLSGLPANAETIQSEIEVITSPDLASRVITSLKLSGSAEFNPLLQKASLWQRLTGGETRNQLVEPDLLQSRLISNFQHRLAVKAAGRSRVIDIAFTSTSPSRAALVANTLAQTYLDDQLQTKLQATRRANSWLESRLEQLRIDAESAEMEVARFRAEAANSENMVRLHTLEREAQASRSLYETFLNRSKQISEQAGLEQADARLIAKAQVPLDPSAPRSRLIILIAAVAALGTGIIVAFVAERLDGGFRSSEQIQQMLSLPTLAMMPSLRSLGVKGQRPEQYIIDKPNSSLAEAVRMLRTSLLLSNVDQPPKILLLTSALPAEGKTTVALTLARLSQAAGEKVLLIDADLRRPRVHEALNTANEKGLVELLAGTATPEQVLKTTEADNKGIHYITAGQPTPHATELIRSQQMRKLVKALSASYSMVIIDSPPVLPVADAKVLATLADKVIYVVRWNDTQREIVAEAVKQLREVSASFAGVVLNHINIERHAEYGYGDSGYYYGKYRKYYTE